MTGACASCGKPWRERSPDCDRHSDWEERASIIEEGSKCSREVAEKRATEDMARAVRAGGR